MMLVEKICTFVVGSEMNKNVNFNIKFWEYLGMSCAKWITIFFLINQRHWFSINILWISHKVSNMHIRKTIFTNNRP